MENRGPFSLHNPRPLSIFSLRVSASKMLCASKSAYSGGKEHNCDGIIFQEVIFCSLCSSNGKQHMFLETEHRNNPKGEMRSLAAYLRYVALPCQSNNSLDENMFLLANLKHIEKMTQYSQ